MIDDDILNEQSIKIQLLKDKYSALRNEYHEEKKKRSNGNNWTAEEHFNTK